MNRAARIGLVITTYQRPDALAMVLRAALSQQRPFDEILVADDGSGPATREVVATAARDAAIPVEHVWHPDQGFRAAAIRNRAIARARADYLVFIDGDCVVRPNFAARHLALSESGWFVAGNRILLSERYTAKLLASGDPAPLRDPRELLRQRREGGVNRLLPLISRGAAGRWRKRHPQRWEGGKTCNLGAWRDDLLRVDGFDEAFEGWGMEDSDLVIRLLHAGVRRKDGRFATGLFHLWHPENDRSRLTENVARLETLMAGTRVLPVQGISGSHAPAAPQPPVSTGQADEHEDGRIADPAG